MAKKGKKGRGDDDDSPSEAVVENENAPSKQPQGKKGKKGRGGAKGDDSDAEDVPSQPVASEDAEGAVKTKEKKQKKKDKKKKGKHDDFSDDDAELPAVSTAPPKGGKNGKTAKAAAFDILDDVDANGADEEAADEAESGENLVVVEVFEVKRHSKSTSHKIATLFDGDNLFKVVTDVLDLEEGTLVILAKPGCVLPGPQIKVGISKVSGVKSEGRLCSAFDVGWTENEHDSKLVELQEDWNLMSGDPCPMAPPQGWTAAHRAEEEAQAAAADEEEEDEEDDDEQEENKQPNASGKGQGPANAFAGLMGGDDDEEEEEEEEEEEQARAPPAQKKGKQDKKKAAANAFAGLLGDDEEEEEEDDEKPSPSRTSPPRKGKQDKKKAAANAFAGLLGDDDEEEQEQEEASPERAAPKKGKQSKKKAAANAFAGLMGDDEEEEEGSGSASPPPTKGKKGKDSKKAAAANAFAGLAGSDDEDEPAPAPKPKADKKKAKKAAAASAFAGLLDEDEEEPEEVAPAKKAGKKDKKKSAAASAFAGLMGDDEDEVDDGGDNGAAARAAEPPAESKKGGKKGKGGATGADEDVDALLAQIDAAPTAAAPSKKDKKKKKGGAAAAADDDEFDAILQELGAPAGGGASSSGRGAEIATEPAEEPLDTVEAVEAALAAPGISATRKKKLKAKLKQLQDAAAGGEGAAAGDAAAADDDDAATNTVEAIQKALENKDLNANQKKKLKAKLKKLQDKEAADKDGESKAPKGKKQSAAVLAMQREIEERRAREEAAAAAEAARRKAEEEARIAAELEEKRLEEERLARLEAKKARKEELRKAGKLLTAKQRAEAARLAAVRERLIAEAKERGISLEEMEAESKPKKVVYDAKKKASAERKRKQEEEERLAREEEERRRQEEAAAAAAKKQEEEKAAAPDAAEDAADDWEEVAEAWDADENEPADAAAEKPDKAKDSTEEDEEEEESDEDSDEESDSESDSDSETDSDDDSDSDSSYSEDSEDEKMRRIEEARERREKRFAAAMQRRDKDDLRSPICCILGHVDTGKTKILDNIRRTNVQDNEAGGITQQIGATYIPSSAVEMRTDRLRAGKAFDMKMPGLLVIDTPGHESFTNLRTRGSSLCDIAVLVVDIMHGLEQQTIESINLLKARKAPFIIALNKIDRMYQWKPIADGPVRESLDSQSKATREEFDKRMEASMLALNEQGLNVELYWKNKDPRRYVNIVPTSAITGEGICDLMWLIVKLTQTMMTDRLMFVEELQCTVLEVKVIEGYGHTVDAVLVNGRLKEGDRIVLCGLDGPIVTTIRSLLTPHPMKELRVKGSYLHHKELKAAQGIKIAAPNLEKAVAGTQLFVVGKDDDEEELCDLVMEDMADIFSKVDKTGEGVCVQASTLGSLEALLEFLSSEAVQIPVSGINIGPVHKKDVMRANVMAEKKLKKYACILAFDLPPLRPDVAELAESLGVKIFSAQIIYHLFDEFTAHMKRCKLEEQEGAKNDAIFPCRLKIMPGCVFNSKDPILLGVEIVEGQARIGAPICVAHGGTFIDLGRITGLEREHKAVDKAVRGDSVAVKLEGSNALFGRHFNIQDELISRITRDSINALKLHFRDQMTRPDWELVIKLKKVLRVD